MLDRWRRTLGIVVGARTLSVVLLRGWRQPEPRLLLERELEAGGSPEALARVLAESLRSIDMPGVRSRVVLTEPWVRYWRVEPPLNAWRWRDFEAMTRMRFEQVYDESPDAWRIAFEASAQGPFLACGIALAVVAGLQSALAAERITLLSVQPELTLLWNRWHAQLGDANCFGVWQDGHLSVAMVQSGRVVGWRRLGELSAESADKPLQVLQQEALRLGMDLPQTLASCGKMPANLKLGLRHRALGSHSSALSVWGLDA